MAMRSFTYVASGCFGSRRSASASVASAFGLLPVGEERARELEQLLGVLRIGLHRLARVVERRRVVIGHELLLVALEARLEPGAELLVELLARDAQRLLHHVGRALAVRPSEASSTRPSGSRISRP
jgi:hypothetical protein